MRAFVYGYLWAYLSYVKSLHTQLKIRTEAAPFEPGGQKPVKSCNCEKGLYYI